MLFAGIVISAVAVFLGIVTKLPQGGGGLANNLMVLSLFLPAPPLLPAPPPMKTLFDFEAAIAEYKLYYIRNPMVAKNATQGPIPHPSLIPRSGARSSKATAQSRKFKILPFLFPAFSIPEEAIRLYLTIGEAIGTLAMVFIALCLPWLVARQVHLLGKTRPARKQMAMEFGQQVAQIELNCLFEDIKFLVLERNGAFAQLRDTREQAREAGIKAAELSSAKEEALKELLVKRNDALAELAKGKAELKKLDEENKMEVDGLRKETTNQLRAWEEKEKRWKDRRAEEERRSKEVIDGLGMRREREVESWKRQVEGLEGEKKEETEAFEARLKNILGRMISEREGWGKEKERLRGEKEGEKAEKEKLAAEKADLEEKRIGEKEAWEEASERAHRRIAELEKALEDKATEGQREKEEAEAKRKIAEAEKDREQAEAKKAIAQLEEEVLNGRKLIEDLQTDKRRDRQLLLELRAQLVRQTHPAPPNHMNSLRFGGGAPPPPTPGPPGFPRVNFPTSLTPPPHLTAAEQLPPRPTVCLPPAKPTRGPSSGQPTSRSPPPNAPRGPKSHRRA